MDCAFKLLRRDLAMQLELTCDNFFVSTELVVAARRLRAHMVEKGVRHYPRAAGETTVRPSDIPRTLVEVARMWSRAHRPRRSS